MKKWLLLFHWFTCSIGLTGVIYGLSWKLHAVLLIRRPLTKYNEWAIPFFFPNKPQQLIFFVATGMCLFLYYLLVCYVMNKRDERLSTVYNMTDLSRKRSILLYVLLPLLINAIVAAYFPSAARPRLPMSAYALIALWFSAVCLPFYPAFSQVSGRFWGIDQKLWQVTEKANQYLEGRVYLWIASGLVVLCSIQLVLIFLPFLRGEPLMMNEYLNVPERTLVDRQYVVNAEYINSHNLGGLLIYNPDLREASTLPRPGTFVEVPKTELLEQFIKKNSTKYYYDEALQALIVHRPMTVEERTELSAIVDHDHAAKIISLYYILKDQADQLHNRLYTPEELDFLRKNRFEMHWQLLNRWVIHHHNYVLGPINEYALGKPVGDIYAQYGFMNAVLMKYLLEKTGGVSYQNYFQKWYLFWPLYYMLFIAVAGLFFRKVHYVALACVLAFGFINKIDYQFLLLGPGYNPIRHFFDILVMVLFYFYLKTRKTTLLIMGFLFALVGILNNTQFGLFGFGALLVTVLVKALQERDASSRRDAGVATMALIASAIVLQMGGQEGNQIAPYFLEGFFGSPIPPNYLISMILAISACYLLLLLWENVSREFRYLGLFLLVYSQGVALYYVWHGGDKHFFKAASMVVVGGVLFIKLVIDHTSMKRFERLIITSLIVAALSMVYVPGVLSYYSMRQEYENIFLTHKTYDWNLETAKFRSTMDPKYFVDSIALIQEYVPSDNAIHLISKYDNFLPFLAKKYSAMPFFDLQWFLLTSKEVNLCIERIQTQKPQYLFVDTDIERDLNGEIVADGLQFISEPGGESLMRVQRLNLLKYIFVAVKKHYEPVKHGTLLTVYKRKLKEEKDPMTNGTLLK